MRTAIALACGLLLTANAYAQEATLSITPNKCVALKKGQICYQTLRIQYSSSTSSDFCLIVGNEAEPLQCWVMSDRAEIRYRFESSEEVEFKIIDSDQHILANALFNVAWVYKESRKRNRWRLF